MNRRGATESANRHEFPAEKVAREELLRRGSDHFDRLYAEGAKQPRVMALAVHPYNSGVPHRIKYFEAVYDYMRKKKGVWMTTGEEIYEWYCSQRR